MPVVANSFRSPYVFLSLSGVDNPWVPDFSLGANFFIELNGPLTIETPINTIVGQTGLFEILMNHHTADVWWGSYAFHEGQGFALDTGTGRSNVVQYRVLNVEDSGVPRVLLTPIALAAITSGS